MPPDIICNYNLLIVELSKKQHTAFFIESKVEI